MASQAASHRISALGLGQVVVAFRAALDLGLLFHCRLELAAACDAAVVAIAAGEFVGAFNDHPAARSGDLALERSSRGPYQGGG